MSQRGDVFATACTGCGGFLVNIFKPGWLSFIPEDIYPAIGNGGLVLMLVSACYFLRPSFFGSTIGELMSHKLGKRKRRMFGLLPPSEKPQPDSSTTERPPGHTAFVLHSMDGLIVEKADIVGYERVLEAKDSKNIRFGELNAKVDKPKEG